MEPNSTARNQHARNTLYNPLTILSTSAPMASKQYQILYKTTSQDYGSPWIHNGQRPEQTDLRRDTVPTYSEIGASLKDFRKTERLIKSQVVKEVLQREGIDPASDNHKFQRTTEFHATKGYSDYPQRGLRIGNLIYQTTNMDYGSSKPSSAQIQDKYFPCNSNFSRSFNGGPLRFNGLNTAKTLSGVHDSLNEM